MFRLLWVVLRLCRWFKLVLASICSTFFCFTSFRRFLDVWRVVGCLRSLGCILEIRVVKSDSDSCNLSG